MFGNWKYIFKNIWLVLPFALVPGVFLALSLDYSAISSYAKGFFAGNPRADFIKFFRVLSFLRIDGWLGAVFTVCAVVCIIVFMAAMLSVVEKHMRIGKRTLSGVFSQILALIPTATLLTAVYFVLYEVWGVVLSAVCFAVCRIGATAAVYVFLVLAFLVFTFILFYAATTFYLWFPCMQITGFRPYDAFVYSYRLMCKVRWRLIAAFAISFGGAFAAIGGCAFLPYIAFWAIAFVLFCALFLSFLVRMETVYFKADKLDREDELRSYREL